MDFDIVIVMESPGIVYLTIPVNANLKSEYEIKLIVQGLCHLWGIPYLVVVLSNLFA